MVLKLTIPEGLEGGLFENDVKMYGTQTAIFSANCVHPFENDVKMFKMWKSIEIHWIW